MFEKIDHIGIAVSDLDKAIAFYREQIGLEYKGVEEVEDQKVKIGFFLVGESKIELLAATDPDGPVGKFIDKNGEGIHHLAFYVSDLDAKLRHLQEQGVELIDKAPRFGAGGARIAFVHPRATGVLIELCER